MWDRCEDGFWVSNCFKGSGDDTSVEMAALERGINSRLPSVDRWNVGDGSTSKKSTKARGSENSKMDVHDIFSAKRGERTTSNVWELALDRHGHFRSLGASRSAAPLCGC